MKANNSIGKHYWELTGKFLTREATTSEQEALKKWASESDQNRRELEELMLLLEKTDHFFQLKKFNSNTAWQKTHQRIGSGATSNATNNNPQRAFIASFYKYAAIIVIALLLGSIGYYFGFRNQSIGTCQEIASAEKEIINEFVLPDGSVVTLNSRSKLQFPKKFKNNRREVIITGEAFFDVQPDPEKPFIIQAGNAQIKVLGTSFNVCAYPETETVEVAVETGTVQVICPDQQKQAEPAELVLNAGEKGILVHSVNILKKSLNTDPNYLAWKTRHLVFDKTPLHEVIQSINKTYHADILIEGEELNQLVLTARFDKKPVHFILNVVQLTFGLELTQKNDTYILSENKTLNK